MTRAATILGLTLILATPAFGQPATLDGKWKVKRKTQRFKLRLEGKTYTGIALSPKHKKPHHLTLTRSGSRWTLSLQTADESTLGLADRVEGDSTESQRWVGNREVPLTMWQSRRRTTGPRTFRNRSRRRELRSADKEFRIYLPRHFDPDEIGEGTLEGGADTAPVESAVLPVVKVLITGFDRFPLLKNHPRWVQDGRINGGEPRINPAGWVVRNFTVENLCAEFNGKVKVELYKCLDVPVTYVNGAKVITETIERVKPDVVIAFGVGADSGSADVEKTCENVMDDSWESVADHGVGPFQLPAAWPPEGDRYSWSEDDQLWLSRYPDNDGVSYNGAKIDPQGSEHLASLLPVDRIVTRVRKENLRAIDGGSGPGRYICNNVMYKVIQTQAKNERLGGFIHLAQWSESRRDNYLKVVACAVEESALAFVEEQAAAGLPGIPVVNALEIIPVVNAPEATPVVDAPEVDVTTSVRDR